MFYEVFEDLCRKNGYTPSGACIAMGRSKNLAAKWKSTGANPSAEVLAEIARFFDVTVDYLVGNEPQADARQKIFETPGQRVLFDAMKNVPEAKLYEVSAQLMRWKEENQIDPY